VARKPLHAVLRPDGTLSFRCAVAYARMPMPGYTRLQNALMLSVYVECFKYQKHGNEKCWVKAARMFASRTTTEAEQALYLNTLAATAAMRFNRDYTVVLDASFKKPKECEDGIQRPFIE
jgi:hypothetical protein